MGRGRSLMAPFATTVLAKCVEICPLHYRRFQARKPRFSFTSIMTTTLRQVFDERACPQVLVAPYKDTVAECSHPVGLFLRAGNDRFGTTLE